MPLKPSMGGMPLSFHSDPTKYGYVLYQGTKCVQDGPWWETCHDEVRSSLTFPPLTVPM